MKSFKRVFSFVFLGFIAFFVFCFKTYAKEVNVYVFYGKTCPHCEEALKYLEKIKDEYDLRIYKYEVWYDKENVDIMNEVAGYLDVNVRGVPFTIIDNTAIVGYAEGNTEDIYKYHIKKASKDDFYDKVGVKLGVVKEKKVSSEKKINEKSENSFNIKIPIIGEIDLKKLSIPVAAILIGIVDGFNPCAMWVLLFLISTLIGMKDKKRLWTLGLTFLTSSALVYLAFMVSWLSFAKMVSSISIVRMLIALVAIIGGVININSYIKSVGKDDGCDVVDAKKRKKIFSKIRKFTHEKSFIIAILGIILLAASVNIIELACSAGLPVIFTELLVINNLSKAQYWIYILIYILFFMLDDLIVFAFAVKTMELTGISTKYNKYSHLIGGIIMFIIGVLLLVKPEWLMFNF